MRKFYIKSTTKNPADLYVRVHSRLPKIDFVLNTKISVDVAFWNEYGQDWERLGKTKDGKPLKIQLTSIDNAIDLALENEDATADLIRECVSDVTHGKEKEEQRRGKEERERRKKEEEERLRQQEARKKADVLLYLESIISDMKEEAVNIEKGKKQGEKYAKGTIQSYTNLFGVLSKFLDGETLTWDELTKRKINRFQAWMKATGYMTKTIKRYTSTLRAVANRAFDDELHHISNISKRFIIKEAAKEEKVAEIYLTENEINALYAMNLTGEEEKVRDVFVFGCDCCQRVSDYSSLRRENFTKSKIDGRDVIKIKQQKTGKTVFIDLTARLKEIAEKYNYQLPNIHPTIINKIIKSICRKLSQKVKSLKELVPTVLKLQEKKTDVVWQTDESGRVFKPRWQLVSSHTARRSSITNRFIKGEPISKIMRRSGHSNFRTFVEYIKVSDEEFAELAERRMNEEEGEEA